MRQTTRYISKKTREEMTWRENEKLFQNTFNKPTNDNWKEYCEWRDKNFEEKIVYVETPYERTKNAVYATGNRWAIENFNETHN